MTDWNSEQFDAFNSGVTEGYGFEIIEEQVRIFIDVLDINPEHKSLISLKMLGKVTGQKIRELEGESRRILTLGEDIMVPYCTINGSISDHPALLRQAGLTVVKS